MLLRRIYAVAKSCPQARAALVTIGTNDTFFNTPVDVYANSLSQIVAVLKEDRECVGIGLLPPACGPGTADYPVDAQQQIDAFNVIISDVASSFDCFLVDFRELGDYLVDTVHFGNAGYRKMAEIWCDALEKSAFHQIPHAPDR